MVKKSPGYECSSCGHRVSKWVGRCPSCGEWGTVVEARPAATAVGAAGRSGSSGRVAGLTPTAAARRVTDIDPAGARHRPSGIGELDRVLGGGVVPGSAVLLAGEPGVGKSTLLLEVANRWARLGRSVLYLTAEESVGQVRHRADRTGALSDNLYLAAENDLETALGQIDQVGPELVIVDSLQTLHATGVEGVAGGVAQTRAVASTLTTLAKSTGIPVLLVGHVTKEGAVAGPRTVEHLVDVVLQFEGDRHSALRFLRGQKNRFGSTDEVGCFEQTAEGIREVSDPSGLFLHQRDQPVSGTAVAVLMDGRRAMVGEIQTLALESKQHTPRRVVTGIDANRVAMVLAVLAQRCKLDMMDREVYAATVGGMRIIEPAADLATALALASTVAERPLPPGLVAVGEVGLGGEVRRVPDLRFRLAEAARLGFTTAVVPRATNTVDQANPAGLRVVPVETLSEALATFHLNKTATKEVDA
jgi:DNA repair protein RadA/Sms